MALNKLRKNIRDYLLKESSGQMHLDFPKEKDEFETPPNAFDEAGVGDIIKALNSDQRSILINANDDQKNRFIEKLKVVKDDEGKKAVFLARAAGTSDIGGLFFALNKALDA